MIDDENAFLKVFAFIPGVRKRKWLYSEISPSTASALFEVNIEGTRGFGAVIIWALVF